MKRSFLLGVLAPIVAAGSLHAASDYLLEIDGIKGESKDRHSQAIEIESFSWGATNSAASGGGGGAGKASFQDLHFTTKLSQAGPQLLLAVTRTNPIPQATMWVRRPGETNDYYRIELENVLVTSYSQHGVSSAAAGDPAPTDTFSLNFARITLSYTGTDGTNTTGTAANALALTPPR